MSSDRNILFRLLEKYQKKLQKEEELKPFFKPTFFPSLSQISNVNLCNTSNPIKAKKFLDVWTIMSIVHSEQEFTLENAHLVFNKFEDILFTLKDNSKIFNDFEREEVINPAISDIDMCIYCKLDKAISNLSIKEAEDWLLFAEKAQRKWKAYDMKSTIRLGLILLIQCFGHEVISDHKLIILALQNLKKDKRYKIFLEKAFICLENNIEDRLISKKLWILLQKYEFDEHNSKKLENFGNQLLKWTLWENREIRNNIKTIWKLFKKKSIERNIWKIVNKIHVQFGNISDNPFEVFKKEDFNFGKILSQNYQTKSRIYKGMMKSNGQKVVIKEYKFEEIDKAVKKIACNEAGFAIFLNKKDEIFMEFYGLYLEFDPDTSEFSFGIIMEKCDMDLEKAIIKKRFDDNRSIENCIDKLLKGVKLLHDFGIAHRDIKPKNIFVNETMNGLNIKIADYNTCSFISEETGLLSMQTVTNCVGQKTYFPPEIDTSMDYNYLPRRIIINKLKADVYSLGLVFLQLYRKEISFRSCSEREEWMENIGRNYINSEIKVTWIKDLLLSMLAKDPDERKRLSELFKIRKCYPNKIYEIPPDNKPTLFIRLAQKYEKDLKNEDELKPFFWSTVLPSFSQLTKVNIGNSYNTIKIKNF